MDGQQNIKDNNGKELIYTEIANIQERLQEQDEELQQQKADIAAQQLEIARLQRQIKSVQRLQEPVQEVIKALPAKPEPPKESTAERNAKKIMPDGVSVNDICKEFGVTRKTVWNWMDAGKLDYRLVNNRRLVPKESLDAFRAEMLANKGRGKKG